MKLFSLTSASINLGELQLLCLDTDAILLRQDAVYLTKRNDIVWPTSLLYVLDIDLQARNIVDVTKLATITPITARKWVELSIQASQNILYQHNE